MDASAPLPLVPDAALESDIAAIAQKGAGKTYTMRGLVERLLDVDRRVVIMDPLNSWWGLKALADGGPGYPVIVVGGPNADVPLNIHGGELLARYIAEAHVSVVIDTSDLRRGEMIRFAQEFLSELYRVNRAALWLVLEEADVFAPQQPMVDATMLLHTVDQIARRGRARGFRLWSLTQRPAKIHKDVLTQTSTLLALRVRSPQDRGAVEAWIEGHATKEDTREVMDSLASLPTGEGWVWAPDQDLLVRGRFPPIRTLDTSATPAAGAEAVEIRELAKGDVEALQAAIAPPAPTAPAKGLVAPHAMSEAERKVIAHAAHQQGFNAGVERGRMLGMSGAIAELRTIIKRMEEVAYTDVSESKVSDAEYVNRPLKRVDERVTPQKPRDPREEIPFPLGPNEKVPKAVKDIIAFYQAIYPRAVPFLQAAKQAGVGLKSSQFKTYEPMLMRTRSVEVVGDRYRAYESVGTPDEYLDRVRDQLAPAQTRIFEFVRHAGRPVTREEIVTACEISPTSSTTMATLSLLVNEAAVVEKVGDGWQMTEVYR